MGRRAGFKVAYGNLDVRILLNDIRGEQMRLVLAARVCDSDESVFLACDMQLHKLLWNDEPGR